MDAITLLKNDHKTVNRLFRDYEAAGDRAFTEKRAIVDRIIEELSIHAAIEEQLFYPVARATVSGVEAVTLESLEEHHIVKWVLSELDSMPAHHERFDAKVTVLIENVRHHVKEEEDDLFPKVREELGRAALRELGDAMETARGLAPTKPHPEAPDTPPGNVVTGTASGVADRIGDTMSGIAQGSMQAAGDVVATILGKRKPRRSATGSTRARTTANKVRTELDDAAQSVIDAVTSSEGKASKASNGSNGSARSAQKSSAKVARKPVAKPSAKASVTAAKRTPRPAAKRVKRNTPLKGTAAKTAATTTATKAKSAAKRAARA